MMMPKFLLFPLNLHQYSPMNYSRLLLTVHIKTSPRKLSIGAFLPSICIRKRWSASSRLKYAFCTFHISIRWPIKTNSSCLNPRSGIMEAPFFMHNSWCELFKVSYKYSAVENYLWFTWDCLRCSQPDPPESEHERKQEPRNTALQTTITMQCLMICKYCIEAPKKRKNKTTAVWSSYDTA